MALRKIISWESTSVFFSEFLSYYKLQLVSNWISYIFFNFMIETFSKVSVSSQINVTSYSHSVGQKYIKKEWIIVQIVPRSVQRIKSRLFLFFSQKHWFYHGHKMHSSFPLNCNFMDLSSPWKTNLQHPLKKRM